jgi:formamidopyrimidine-DNA glycosylase
MRVFGAISVRCVVPELPEVETVVRDLRPLLLGRTISSVKAGRKRLRKRWDRKWGPLLRGRRVESVGRRGKWIRIDLDRDVNLVIHLGMTGQLRVVSAREPLAPHTHLIFDLDRGGEQLRFRDVRRFGSATLFRPLDPVERFFERAGLGPEPFALDARYWREQLAKTGRCLKAVLLDQRVVAGVGNIYADEALFEAGLHPATLGRDLNAAAAERLRKAIPKVLERAIEKRGSSIRDYVGGSGRQGEYQREFRVYGQMGQPCPRCGTPIERVRLAGRSTHFCPNCQRV